MWGRVRVWVVVAVVVVAAIGGALPAHVSSAAGGRPSGPLAPESGALFGSWLKPSKFNDPPTLMAEVTQREAEFGRRQDISHTFYFWADHAMWPGVIERWHAESGRIPLVSWGGTYTDQIGSGQHDAVIQAQADKVKDFGHPIFLRWFWEADATENIDRVISPESYIAAWRRIYSTFRQRSVNNAVFVWCPTAYGFVTGDAQKYYPGHEYVDWVCSDGYNWAPGKP